MYENDANQIRQSLLGTNQRRERISKKRFRGEQVGENDASPIVENL